jgi:hypothetical protein
LEATTQVSASKPTYHRTSDSSVATNRSKMNP